MCTQRLAPLSHIFRCTAKDMDRRQQHPPYPPAGAHTAPNTNNLDVFIGRLALASLSVSCKFPAYTGIQAICMYKSRVNHS
jgi:hypothetical protein